MSRTSEQSLFFTNVARHTPDPTTSRVFKMESRAREHQLELKEKMLLQLKEVSDSGIDFNFKSWYTFWRFWMLGQGKRTSSLGQFFCQKVRASTSGRNSRNPTRVSKWTDRKTTRAKCWKGSFQPSTSVKCKSVNQNHVL